MATMSVRALTFIVYLLCGVFIGCLFAGSCSDTLPTVEGASVCQQSTRRSTSRGVATETMKAKFCCDETGDDLGEANCTNGVWTEAPLASNCKPASTDGESSNGSSDDGSSSSGGSSGGSSSDSGTTMCPANNVTYGAPFSTPVTSPTCDDGWSPAMCLPASDSLKQLVPVPKDAIVQMHNCWRQSNNLPGPTPAKTLNELLWDDKLAQMAERAAAQCTGEHTPPSQQFMPAHDGQAAWRWIGQNIFGMSVNSSDITGQALSHPRAGWATSEIDKYCYGCPNNAAGHYTQVIAERSLYVGCGQAICSDMVYVYCNYGPGGNYNDGLSKPYNAGGN